jgi:23S rRNA (guanosine2251-2'-O)-methyltransferase
VSRRPDHRQPRKGRRPLFPPRSPAERRSDAIWIYGIHAVLAALANPRRKVRRIVATPNALVRLREAGAALLMDPEEASPRQIDHLLGGDAVHQGIAVEVAPLDPQDVDVLAAGRLVVVLDQITDPHNVGAILRSALALGADGVVSTARHAPPETGVLAKAASGALDRIAMVEVPNLARALAALGEFGYVRIGLDSDADLAIEEAMRGEKVALVLGAEGKGLRRLTRDTCDVVARLPVPGPLASLNVSNAAVLALYIARRHLDRT